MSPFCRLWSTSSVQYSDGFSECLTDCRRDGGRPATVQVTRTHQILDTPTHTHTTFQTYSHTHTHHVLDIPTHKDTPRSRHTHTQTHTTFQTYPHTNTPDSKHTHTCSCLNCHFPVELIIVQTNFLLQNPNQIQTVLFKNFLGLLGTKNIKIPQHCRLSAQVYFMIMNQFCQIQNQTSTKEVRVLVDGFYMFLSAASPGFPQYQTLEVDWEAWEGRLAVLVRNLRTVYWVNVSENSGAGSVRLSWIKGR